MLMQPSQPVIARVVEPAVESTTVADILIGALGLTGVMLLAALLLGGLLGRTAHRREAAAGSLQPRAYPRRRSDARHSRAATVLIFFREP